MNHPFAIFLSLLLLALCSCDEKQPISEELSIKLSDDPSAGFNDFLVGMGHLIEMSPAELVVVDEGQAYSMTLYSSNHDSVEIESARISMVAHDAFTFGEQKEPVGRNQLVEHVSVYAAACKAADEDPILQLSAAPGISREQGIDLLGTFARMGVFQLEIVDQLSTGPYPSIKKTKNTPPSRGEIHADPASD